MPTARDLSVPFSFAWAAPRGAASRAGINPGFSDKIARIRAGDNDWLGLTSDDHAKLKGPMERCDA
jgi:hypothetical protein